MKKFLTVLLPITLLTLIGTFFLNNSAFAASDCARYEQGERYENCMKQEGNYDSRNNNDSYVESNCTSFLGMTPWSCGVDIHDEESLKTGIWMIAANVLTDITVIASYLVLGYVIYGGYLYTFSAGDPNKVARGKKTLSQAFIGLAIVLSATAIMSTIRAVLLTNNSSLAACATKECTSPAKMVTDIVNWFIAMAGIVSAIFVVYGGISYTTSAGDPGKLQKAKNMIFYALIGLAVVALATAITAFVRSRIDEAVENAYHNETIISKEVYETKTY